MCTRRKALKMKLPGFALSIIVILETIGIIPNIPIKNSLQLSRSSFVLIKDGSFEIHGIRFVPYGSTMYPHWSIDNHVIYGSGWEDPRFTTYIDSIIILAKQAGINTIRPTNFFDGVVSTTDSGWWKNPRVWSNMDYLLTKAYHNNMYVLLDLSSYRDRLLRAGTYPYNPVDWVNFLTFVGKRYMNNPAIVNYAIAGEVACPNGNTSLRPKSTTDLTQFYAHVTQTLYLADPNHLISSGGLSYLNEPDCGIDWQAIFSLPNISIAAIHVYSNNDRRISIPMVSVWAHHHHVPFTVEEFGFKQNMGDANRAKAFNTIYSLLSPTYYDAKSVVFWNLGTELDPNSYEVGPQTPITWKIIRQNDFTQAST